MKKNQISRELILVLMIFLITSVACNLASALTQPAEESAATMTPVPTATQTAVILSTTTASPSPTRLPTATPVATQTPTLTPTPIPTYTVLRGQVLVRSNCRYGPGAVYLYKYGLVPGSNLDVIGRTDRGTWILVQAIGGNNPCWVKASLMEIKGDVMNVQPTYIPLPPSPYYRPPSGVSAVRDGDEVTISWNPISLRAGDDQASPSYVVEAWVCVAGKLVFTPLGSYVPVVSVQDQTGCSEPSHARLFAAEKHGYTRPVEVPWPAEQ
jgi:hypothetical protein